MKLLPSTPRIVLLMSLAACAGTDELTGGSNPDGDGGSTTSGTRGDGGSGGDGFGTGGAGGAPECLEEELCDGVDNDCDGEVDEGCDCMPSETRPCYTGDSAQIGVGLCAEGIQDCTETGKWSPICQGEVLPAAEVCDGEDNDCNGMADDGFGTQSCGLGLCATSVQECQNGEPVECVPLAPPDPIEDCDGVDDDCDGTVDEGCACQNGQMQACYTGPAGTAGVGICAAGTSTCVGGQWGSCVGQVTPAAEVCDAIDQDCDGNINEGTCSLPNAVSTCSGGGCVISSCNPGYDHCDTNIANGCETRHSGSSNSPPGQYLGSFNADAYYGFACQSGGACEGPVATATGTQGRHFSLDALEESSCCSYVSVRVELIVPAGIDYDLFVTGTSCFADPGFQSIHGTGVNESIVLYCNDDCGGADNSFNAGIEVRYYNGSSCQPWTLNVYRRAC